MRPIPPYSTDLLYKEDYKEDDLIALGNALGVGDLKVITTTTLNPERLLYHACLTAIQTYVKLEQLDESGRAVEIADLADTLYAAIKKPYLEKIVETKDNMLKKEHEVINFSAELDKSENKIPWDSVRFNNTWNTSDYPQRWQKKAIESYRAVRARVESGEYKLRGHETIGDLVAEWGRLNVHYKHYRDAARSLIEEHIQHDLPPEKLLTMHHTNDRTMTMFLGGMGSGKSEMSQHYIANRPEEKRNDFALHNADCLKLALYRSAKKDGKIPADHAYKGEEIQAESSNALYEATRKRGFLARQKFHAPDVVLNSIVLGSFEVMEGISSGGTIVAHHIHMPTQEGIEEAEKRALTEGRAPSAADVKWSTTASAKSLLLLTEPAYKSINLTVHLYERHTGKAPQYYGSIDASKKIFYVQNLDALAELSQSIFEKKSKEKSLEHLLNAYTSAGFTVALVRETSHEPVATLDASRSLVIDSSHMWNQQNDLREAFLNIANTTKIGEPLVSRFLKPAGALHVGR